MLSLLQNSRLAFEFGPLRLAFSHLFLMGFAAIAAGLAVLLLLPRFFGRLPRDRGKALVADGKSSAGKPTGAGLPVFLLSLPAILLALPMRDACGIVFPCTPQWEIVGCLALAMATGYLDDRSEKEWGRVRKGLLDLAVALLAALALCQCKPAEIWLPVTKRVFSLPWPAYVAMATPVLWFTINATNCSDGVDGLAGSLTEIALVMLAMLLYVVVGYRPVAHYFLIPCYAEAARWAILVMIVAGGFGGYLWFNAEPSKILMGDAGSRFLGMLVATASLMTGNPLVVLALAPVVLVNGGGGLAKLVLLRVAKRLGRDIGEDNVIRRVRFPLHDHCKKNLGWSNAQVLMRFTLLQLVVMPILLVLLVKIR